MRRQRALTISSFILHSLIFVVARCWRMITKLNKLKCIYLIRGAMKEGAECGERPQQKPIVHFINRFYVQFDQKGNSAAGGWWVLAMACIQCHTATQQKLEFSARNYFPNAICSLLSLSYLTMTPSSARVRTQSLHIIRPQMPHTRRSEQREMNSNIVALSCHSIRFELVEFSVPLSGILFADLYHFVSFLFPPHFWTKQKKIAFHFLLLTKDN